MPVVTINNNKLYYETHGEGHPLVLITGYGCDLTYWETIKHALGEHFQLVLFDNRCSGRTECKDESFTIEQMADDVAKLIDLLNLKKPHILGHSMGGAIAQTLAYKFPEKVGKVILYHSIFKKLSPINQAVSQFVIQLREDKIASRREIEAFMPWLLSNDFMSDPNKREFFIHIKQNEPFPMSTAGLKRQLEAMAGFDSTPWYKRIQANVLVLCGEEDLCAPKKDVEILAEGIPGAKLHVFKEQAHMTHIEQPEPFCRVALEYLLA